MKSHMVTHPFDGHRSIHHDPQPWCAFIPPAGREAGGGSTEEACARLVGTTRHRRRFGKISDAIWSYAELGMQEFKSSKLLATRSSRPASS